MSKLKSATAKAPVASKNIDKKENIARIMQVIPIILIAAFVPIMVQLRVVTVPDNIGMFWSSDGIHMDFFSKAKATYLLIFAGLSVLVLIGFKLTKLGASTGVISLENKTLLQKLFYKNETLQMERVICVPLAIYTVFTVLSAMMSEYKEVALNGFPDRYEGLWVLLAYIAVWVTIIGLVKDAKQMNWIVAAIVFSGVIMCVIGIGQYFGADIFKTDIGKEFMIPDKYIKIRDELNFNMPVGRAYSTLFNSNNVGSMMSMLGVFGLSFAIFAKSIYLKIIALVFAGINIFTLLASNSRGGYLGAFAGVVFLALMVLLTYKLNPKYIAAAVAVLIVPIVIVTVADDKFSNLSNLSLDNLIGQPIKPVSERQSDDTATQMLGFTTQADTVEIMTNAGNLYIKYLGDDTIELKDSDNNTINYTMNENVAVNADKRFSGVRVALEDSMIEVRFGYNLEFAFNENELWFIGPNGYLVKAEEEAPVYPELFAQYGRMGSSRGIIWGKTIPLLKDTFLIGKGPDNFAMYYPQNDYTAKINYLETPLIIVDKPHNQYLQIALNQGVISLIGFIVALAIYYFWSIKNLIKRRDVSGLYTAYNAAISSGMAAYLVAGIFNDSIVSVAPIFWIMWGLGCAVNCMISKTPIAE